MKRLSFLILLLCCNYCFGQAAEEVLKNIKTYEDIKALMAKNPLVHGDLAEIKSFADTNTWQKQLYTHKTGDIVTIGKRIYKVIWDTTAIFLRVSYIYLDGSTLSMGKIDSLRQYIMDEYSRGVAFSLLAKEFSMDGSNENGGDLNWFIGGNMVSEFTDAINKHKVPDVFKVDVPGNKWYYVVKKTYESKQGTEMTVFSIDNTASNN